MLEETIPLDSYEDPFSLFLKAFENKFSIIIHKIDVEEGQTATIYYEKLVPAGAGF